MPSVPKPIVIFTSGVFLLLLCVVVGWILVPQLIHDQIAHEFQIRNGSELWPNWITPPVPVYFKVYLFNVTNPDEISQHGKLPVLAEVGPYVFKELREKIDITENPSEGTVRYKERITYFFDSQKSKGLREEDVLTILNVPYVAMAQKVSELTYPLSELGLTYVVKFKQTPFISKNVREILFQGWHLPMVAELSELLGQEVLPNNTFGLFYGKNGTDDGYLEVDSGARNSASMGKVLSWRGKTELSWWKEGSACNQFQGTDGTVFAPFITKKQTVHIFNADLCRSLHLTFSEEVNFMGIPAYRFRAPKELFEDPRTSADNLCYCLEEDIQDCPGTGVIDLSVCRDGAPVAMSTPHFLDGDERYAQKAGLTPVRDLHETVLDFEPITGIVLHAHKRIQVNVVTKPVRALRSLRSMPEMTFPILWADETAEVDTSLAQLIKSQLITPFYILEVVKWLIFGVSIMLIFSSSIYFLKRLNEERYEDSLRRMKMASVKTELVNGHGGNKGEDGLLLQSK